MKRVIILALGLVLGVTGSVYAANSALLFDGQDDYVRVPDSNSLDLTTGMTIEAWIKSNTTSGSRVIVSKWSDPSGDQSYIFKDHNDSDKLRIELSREGHNDLADLEGQTSIDTGNWIHVAATYDSSSVKLFYNGVLDNSGDPKVINSQIYVGLADLLIGSVHGGEDFDGLIDEVRIWNYARTQQQLQDNMFYALTGQETGLMAYWNFDEGSGQMAYDLTSNNNDGQLGSTTGVDGNDPQWVLSDGRYGQSRDVIPEPSSLLLLGSALLAAGAFKRRRLA